MTSLALMLVMSLGAEPVDETVPLSQLSGAWVGKRTIDKLGQCGFSGGDRTEAVDITVTDDGVLEMRGGVLATGEVSPSWRVTAENAAATAQCGDEHRKYTVRYEGLVTRKGEDFHLDIEAIDTPCPPRCSFRVRLKLRRTEVEE